jgi:F-type H+-transporting ATPase subunit epsilon
MRTFSLSLLDSQGEARFEAVTQFIAADASGSFGLLAGHAAMVALLRYGLARFCDRDGRWHYVALPGGVLRFADNQLTVASARYFLGEERGAMSELLAQALARTDLEIHAARASLAEIEHALARRLAELSGQGSGGLWP